MLLLCLTSADCQANGNPNGNTKADIIHDNTQHNTEARANSEP
jgi:hypothetical protein